MANYLTSYLVAEADLTPDHHKRICDLLVVAFPRYADLFREVSYYYALPDYRLWFEDETGKIVAHLDFERRTISVNGTEVLIAGVGEVAVHPDNHKQGLGRKLMTELHPILKDQFKVDYGFLQCRDEVVGFYQSVGWHKVAQAVKEQHIDTGEMVMSYGNALMMPVCKTVDDWQTGGYIDIRGLPW